MSAVSGLHGRRPRLPVTSAAGAFAATVIVIAGLLAGMGWVYVLRGLHLLHAGPQIGDSLPLLQLAGYDSQPLLRIIVAWLLAGAIVGVALVGWPPARRFALAGLLGIVVLLLDSQISYALTRNLRVTDVLFTRAPGLGPLIEALVFALGSCLPGALAGRQRGGGGHRRSLVTLWTRFDDLGLGGGEHREGAEHGGDRQPVAKGRPRASA